MGGQIEVNCSKHPETQEQKQKQEEAGPDMGWFFWEWKRHKQRVLETHEKAERWISLV